MKGERDVSHAEAPSVVLVTGAARRVGAGIARALHAAGATVALHYRHSAEAAGRQAAALNALRPGSAATFQADLLDLPALPALIDAVVDRFGRLDGLVNNASSFFPTPLGTVDVAAWDDLIGSNLRALPSSPTPCSSRPVSRTISPPRSAFCCSKRHT